MPQGWGPEATSDNYLAILAGGHVTGVLMQGRYVMESVGGRIVKARPLIVLLEDDNGVRRSMQLLLHGRGFDVKAYSSAAPLLADPDLAEVGCLIADYRLGETNGIDVLHSLRERGWNKPAVLITAFNSADMISQATKAGFNTVFDKPVKDHVLIAELERLTGPAGPGSGPLRTS